MIAIKGRDLEKLVLFRAEILETQKVLTLGRYGVQAVMMNSKEPPFKPEWQIIPSLPDLEGVIFGTGRQLIIECKVCSQASHPIHQQGKKHPKQIDHMLRRAEAGALCYYLIHFNPRQLMRSSEPAATYAIPVLPDDPFWRQYEAAEKLTVNREDCRMYGIEVPWNLYSPRASKLTPDLTVLLPESRSGTFQPPDDKKPAQGILGEKTTHLSQGGTSYPSTHVGPPMPQP